MEGFSPELLEIADRVERKLRPAFEQIERRALTNTKRVMDAFREYRVQEGYFAGTTGYGYDDSGRDNLEKIYARVFGTEAALVRTQFVNGTHAIAAGMFACVSSGETLLSITGSVYDTLQTVVGQRGAIGGTFADYGIGFRQIELDAKGEPDLPAIREAVKAPDVKAVFIQRSRGYGVRRTLSSREIGDLAREVKAIRPDMIVMVDNCYGEFCDEQEPTAYGADLICGSLIKNPGGGLAPMGGYVAGRADLVERAAFRLTVPGIGGECGATLGVNRSLYQGFFMAPHIVSQSLKTAAFAAGLMEELGYTVSPRWDEERHDTIQTIAFGAPEPLIAFCQGIQSGSPVDSFASPEPGDMPGYDSQVIMAAGAFVQGSTSELSCDAPMRDPYLLYMQGGLTYESGKLGILLAAQKALK